MLLTGLCFFVFSTTNSVSFHLYYCYFVSSCVLVYSLHCYVPFRLSVCLFVFSSTILLSIYPLHSASTAGCISASPHIFDTNSVEAINLLLVYYVYYYLFFFSSMPNPKKYFATRMLDILIHSFSLEILDDQFKTNRPLLAMTERNISVFKNRRRCTHGCLWTTLT